MGIEKIIMLHNLTITASKKENDIKLIRTLRKSKFCENSPNSQEIQGLDL